MAFSASRPNFILGATSEPQSMELSRLVSDLFKIRDIAAKKLSDHLTGLRREDPEPSVVTDKEKFSKAVSNINYLITNLKELTKDVRSPLSEDELKKKLCDASYIAACDYDERIYMFTLMGKLASDVRFDPDPRVRSQISKFLRDVQTALEPKGTDWCQPL